MTEALRAHGLEITLAEGADHVLPAMDPDMAEVVHTELVDQGTEIRLGEPVIDFEQGEDGLVCAVRTASARWECDLVVLGLGARPNIELARKGGVDIDLTGAIGDDRHDDDERRRGLGRGRLRLDAPTVSRGRPCGFPLARPPTSRVALRGRR